MLIFIVFLVSVNILMVKTENDVVRVIIKQGNHGFCTVHNAQNELTSGTNFILEVSSDFFIKKGTWKHNGVRTVLEDLENSTISVPYTKHNNGKKTYVTFKYNYTHTQMVDESIVGNWKFSFKYLMDYDPWALNYTNVGHCVCNASAKLKRSSRPTLPGTGNKGSDPKKLENGVMPIWVIYVLSFFGLFLVIQSSYIIYGKVKGRRTKRDNDKDPISPKSPKGKRSKTRRNIADRPPLPLPSDEVIQTPPQPPVSPGPVHKHLFPTAPPMRVENSYCTPSDPVPTAPPMRVENSYSTPSDPVPLVSKPSYRHQGSSHEGVRSPVFDRRQQGPLVSNQSDRNKALVTSVEELKKTPGCPRRYMDGPLVPKQSYRSKALVASVEELKKTPGCPRRYMDGPIVPKPTYRKSVSTSDDSDEEHRTPGFARRQIEAKFAQLPPKGVAPPKSFKLPRPLPRSPPSPTMERVPPFNPAHRPEPVPPSHPKKVPVFPPPAPFKMQEPSRMSDDEWVYEQLQPSSKYLNDNFSTTNNYNR